MNHIDLMDDLRDSIGMRGYAQHDPVLEYKREGFEMFEAMNEAIQEDAVRMIMRARLTRETRKPAERRSRGPLTEGRGSSGWSREAAAVAGQLRAGEASPGGGEGDRERQDPVRRKQRPGRNDPCWCGSGKKYKNCHLAEDERDLH
jgi:preprotein translocase subunit SecA